jgi:hypothetical protein
VVDEVQVSSDLLNWVSGPGFVEFVGAVNDGDGTEMAVSRSTTLFGTERREFLRVAATLK